MTRLNDPYAPLRSELAALGYLSGEIHRAIAWYEQHGTFRGCRVLARVDRDYAGLLMDETLPMASVERRG